MSASTSRPRAARRTIQPTHIDESTPGEAESKSAGPGPASASASPIDLTDDADDIELQASTSTQPPPPHHQSARAALIESAPTRTLKRKHDGDDGDDGDAPTAPATVVEAAPSRSRAPRRTASRLAAAHGVPLLQRKDSAPFAAVGDDEGDEDDEDWEERKRPPAKRRGRPPAGAAASAAPTTSTVAASTSASGGAATAATVAPSPPVPFIFLPAHLPDAATRAASERAVQQRFHNWLADSVPVGKTTSRQRNHMPKDLLLQRNLEIQAMMHSFDREYDQLLQQKPDGWQLCVHKLDEANDALAEESDEIETILFEKYRVRGGGRTLVSDEALEAAHHGASMAHHHIARGMPLPQLTLAPQPSSQDGSTTDAAAAAAPAAFATLTASLLPPAEGEVEGEGAGMADIRVKSSSTASSGSASASSAPGAPSSSSSRSGSSASVSAASAAAGAAAASSPLVDSAVAAPASMSRSDAEMWRRFDAEQEATRIRRAERKAKQKDGLLGHYLEYFDRFIENAEAQTQQRHATGARKAKSAPPAASFPLHLGTLVFPLFSGDGVLLPQHLSEAEVPIKREEEEQVEDAAMAATTNAPAPPSDASDNSASARDESAANDVRDDEDGDLDDGDGDGDDGSVSSSSSESDEASGEDVWLDFCFDEQRQLIDGCLVKQLRSLLGAEGNETGETETVTLGVLPLEGMHPPASDEPEQEYDETGAPLPRRARARPMPDPSHPLAALYILHEAANIIRLESALVGPRPAPDEDADADADADAGASDGRARVEVSIHVNSRIFHTQLLRSTAQKRALLTLFRLFSPSSVVPVDAEVEGADATLLPPAPALYPKFDGSMVAYSQLTDEERRAFALTEPEPEPKDESEPARADDGVAPMDVDVDAPASVKVEPSVASAHDSMPLPPVAAAAASTSAPAAQRMGNGRRRAMATQNPSPPLALSLADQAIAGEDIGMSEDDEHDEDGEDEEGEWDSGDEEDALSDGSEAADSSDELFGDTILESDRLVFVELRLPAGGGASGDNMGDDAQTAVAPLLPGDDVVVKTEPTDSPVEEASALTEDEKAEFARLERETAKLDGAVAPVHNNRGVVDAPMDEEEKQLENEQRTKWRPDSLHALFESIRPTPRWSRTTSQPVSLVSTLRPFQQKALAWMVARETDLCVLRHDDPLWERVRLNGRPAWYSATAGVLQRDRPEKHKDVCGGILADEMGLGKTVVTIALILKRPWIPSAADAADAAKDEPSAAAAVSAAPAVKEESADEMKESDADAAIILKQEADVSVAVTNAAAAATPPRPPPKRVGTTLIVSPVSLVYQWEKEIHLHAPSLRVFIYSGLDRCQSTEDAAAAYSAAMAHFSEADVVLATYSTLGREVNYSRQCQHALRGQKRYQVPQSPLLDLHYHRVVLDEAQQVHSEMSVLFRMAARLSCDARWCISGTPIGPMGLHDLYGLVSFLQVRPFDAPAVWRHAMQTSTPEGLARLKRLLRQIMWRHSKVHVLDECSIPALSLNKVYLSFTKIELEYYRCLERECQSRVYFEGARGRLEDRTALKKLDALRQACAHPQASSGTFLGSEVRSLPDIGRMLIKRVMDDETRCERDLCRAMNRLGLELRRQGRINEAEAAFKMSWKISDSGLNADSNDSGATLDRPAKAGAGAGSGSPSKLKARATGSSSSTKLMDDFDSDVNIVTANAQVREWRAIDVVITFNLAQLYRHQLQTEFGLTPDPPLSVGDETCEETFQRVMDEASTIEPEGHGSHKELADKAVAAFNAILPPQLAAAAASASASSSSTAAASASPASASAEEDDSNLSRRALLLKSYHRQRKQYEYSLHDMLDLFELRLIDEAILIGVTYEKDLLPKSVACAVEEVRDLYAERARVGVDQFNSTQQPFMGRVVALEEELQARQKIPADILTLYDLHRSRLLLRGLQQQLQIKSVRRQKERMLEQLATHPRFISMRRMLGAPAKHKSAGTSAASSRKNGAEDAKPSTKPQRSFDDRLARTDQQLRAAITKRERSLGSAIVDRLRAEDDMQHEETMDSPVRLHRARYDAEWTRLRDSIHALSVMREVRDQRRKMRQYTRKLLDHKCAILLEAGIISGANSERWAERRRDELRRLEGGDKEDGKEEGKDAKPKPSPKKKAKLNNAAAAAAAERSDSSGSDPSAASASASPGHSIAASSSASSPQSFQCDSDVAVDIEALRDAAIRRLESDVKALRLKAAAIQTNVTWLKAQFGLLRSGDAQFHSQPCGICTHVITAPTLTVCGHYFDAPCLQKWLTKKSKSGENPTCPTCRHLLGPDDYASFSKEELPTPIRYEAAGEAGPDVAAGGSAPQAQAPEAEEEQSMPPLRRSSTSTSRQSKQMEDVSTSSTVAAAGGASSSTGGAGGVVRSLPRLELSEVQRVSIVGEGQYGSKIETVTKYIKRLREIDPAVQVLVFSQFPRILSMVATALAANSIAYLQLAGTPLQRAKLINRFQSEGSHTAFLLSLRNDNSGLTLVSATVVFLMEPSLNPAVEAQAVNRIHRIGQSRETCVYKFLMRASVEQAIEQMARRERGQLDDGAGGAGDAQAVASGGDALLQHSREAMSVHQLLRVLNLTDDPEQAPDDQEATSNSATATVGPMKARADVNPPQPPAATRAHSTTPST